MDSEEPPNVRVACSGDIDEVVRLMHDAAAWMSPRERPPGTSRDRPDIRGDLRPEIRAPSRELQRRHRRLLHLVGRGSRVLARRPQGGGRISAQARGATDTCGPGCQLRADRGLRHARERRGAPSCGSTATEPAWPIRAARIHPRRHFQSRLDQPSSQNA
ncbi:hypothetical protein MS8345_04734 [Escherichia coli]|nr:hypothetical protein MS8345_04734 [Escherichia coli]